MGLLATPKLAPKDVAYGKNGIRKDLLKQKKAVLEYTGNKDKGMIVIIKPSKKSNYRNLVDILDEMAIVDVPTYAIVNDFTPEELKLLGEGNADNTCCSYYTNSKKALSSITNNKKMKLDILKDHGLEIVFEGRNKIYGAYELRKTNPKTTLKALLIGSLFFGFAVSMLRLL